MAFPTVQTADTKSGTVTSNSNLWTLTYPTNLAADDLLLGFLASDGGSPIVTGYSDAGISQQLAIGGGGATAGVCFAKKCAGTEAGTFTVSLNANEQGAWRIFRITGWYGDDISWLNSVEGVSTNNGSDANPNPPSNNPTNWTVEDTLWFAMCAVDTSRTISVYPLADNQTADVSGGAGGATLGLCSTNSAVASLDPGTFTISTSDDWGALTLAVRPAVSTPPIPRNALPRYGQAVMRSATR